MFSSSVPIENSPLRGGRIGVLPGQYFDQETGLDYNHHRYYNPQTGRYITSDPIGLAGGLNTYGYVYQNPLRYIDPLGLEVDDWRGWGFPSANEHYNRNRNNHCPPKEPNGCGWWNQDQGGLLSNKWRAPTGWECAYDSEGNLLADTVLDGIQNYSHNYGAGTNPWNPKHIWQDVIPHYWYDEADGKYPDGLTNDATTDPNSCDYCAE